MANRITFDPSEDPTPEMMAVEQAALEQGEKLVSAQEEDRARKFEQNEAEQEDVSLIAGKFKSQDDLLKAYNELQKKLSSPSEESSEEAPEEPTEAPVEEVEEAPEVSDHVRSFVDISQRFDQSGSLTDEDMTTLTEMDSKTLIQTYFAYHKAQTNAAFQSAAVQAEMKSIREEVGGDEAYGEMIKWAGDNLQPAEVDMFNSVIQTNNPASIRFAVESLNSRYRGAEGFEAPLVTGKKASSKAVGFRSQAELGRAISDPRYSKDPAYRQDVEERLARSKDLL